MSTIKQLERLHRLRKDGVLTDVEFQAEKQKVIPEKKGFGAQRWRMLAVVAVIGGLVTGVLVFGRHITPSATSRSAPASLASPAMGKPSQRGMVKANNAAVQNRDPDETQRLQFATSADVIGTDPIALQARLGAPKVETQYQLVFEVRGCRLEYAIRGRVVSSLDVDIDDRCQPMINGVKVTPSTTYGQIHLKDPSGNYIASCLTSCGNAADPTVSLSYLGSRATNFIVVDYSANYDQVGDVLEFWERTVRAEQGLGQFDVPDDVEPFSCVSNPTDDISRQLEDVQVRHVQFREEVNGSSC